MSEVRLYMPHDHNALQVCVVGSILTGIISLGPIIMVLLVWAR